MNKIAIIAVLVALGYLFQPPHDIDKGAVLDSYADCYADALAGLSVSGPDDYADNKNPHITDLVENCVYSKHSVEGVYAKYWNEHTAEVFLK